MCKECDSGEMEDVPGHWLLQCSAWDHLRQPLLEAMGAVREDCLVKDDGENACSSNFINYL